MKRVRVSRKAQLAERNMPLRVQGAAVSELPFV
jgi:hypothetical protein